MDKETIGKKVTLRPATEADCKKIFYLFNEAEVRRNSLNQDKITYANHKAWFCKKNQDKNYVFLIAEVADKFAGQVRFDLEKDEALTSVSLHKRFRGYGLGKILLIKGIEYLKNHCPDICYATGQIKEDNISAIKNSQYAGFRFNGETQINGQKFLNCICDLKEV